MDCDAIIEKLYRGEILSEREIKELTWDADVVAEVEQGCGRWTRHMTTVFRVGEDLWGIDWECGLTEMQENMYYNQPRRVKEVTREVTRLETTYVNI